MDKNIYKVIELLGETLEKNELTITCQQYEIENLKKTIDKLTEKANEQIVLIHKD